MQCYRLVCCVQWPGTLECTLYNRNKTQTSGKFQCSVYYTNNQGSGCSFFQHYFLTVINLRTISERAADVQKDVYICFIDYTKAFDRVKHFKMRECLSEIGIDDKYLQIISKLYWEQSASVRTESGMTSEFKTKKGVRQGCVLSPNLFNLYTEKIFREVEDMKGVNIGGVNKKNVKCKW